ncbi:MAG TPA: hypothetical protein VK762_22670 [Polyangiaceae bacterium]|jgi:hypothetical protein|nr:hypothetical protein [Polyangiaceae bacterium]
MAKLILLLLILFSTLVPLALSGSKTPKRTIRSVQIATAIMTFVWAYLCLTYYPQMVSVD